jgi:urease accessory protein
MALLTSSTAFAHTGLPVSGASAGFVHPFSGIDHIATMIAVGIWAAQLGGRALWMLPLSFVAIMSVGGIFGMNGVYVPAVECGIAASVMVLGLLIAFAYKAPLWVGASLVGLFALFHGHAHGNELVGECFGAAYSAGFLLATMLLHCAGIGIALLARKSEFSLVLRVAGGAISVCGLLLLLGY